MIVKAKAISFVKRFSEEFRDPFVAKILFITFVRPICIGIWLCGIEP